MYVYIYIYIYIFIYIPIYVSDSAAVCRVCVIVQCAPPKKKKKCAWEAHVCVLTQSCLVHYEQALVCLSNRDIFDASRGRTFHCKTAKNRFFF